MNLDSKYKELRQKAESLLKEKGAEKSEKYYDDIEKLVEELNIHQIELEMQNLELQETNEKLVIQQKRYKELYLNAPVAYFTLNKTGNIVELNQAAADMLKTPIQAFKYTSVFPYLEENSKNNFTKYFKQVFDSDKIEYGEIIFKNRKEELIYANLSAVSYFDNDLNEKLVRCSVIDKTLLKKYEHEINEQKEYNSLLSRYQTIVSTTNAGIGITDSNGFITEYNTAFAKLLEYEADELIGKNIRLLNHPADRDREHDLFQSITPENSQVRIEKRYITKNNQIVWIDLTAMAIFNEDNELEQTVGIMVDITQRKKNDSETYELNIKLNNTVEELNAINAELRDTNLLIENERKQFLSILDSIPENIYVEDIKTHKILFANKHLKKVYGRDITGEICFEALQKNKDSCDFCPINNILNSNEPYFWEYYNPILEKHFYVMDTKIKWTDQQEVHFQLATDITERKKAVEKITQINHRLEASMQSGDMAWWEMELPSGAIVFNPNKARMLGRNPDDFTHYNDFMKLLHPDDYDNAMAAMHKLINGEKEVYDCRYRIKTAEDKYIWFHDTGIITSKSKEKIVITGIVRDVNQQKIAEQAIKESEEKYKELFEANTDSITIFRINPNGTPSNILEMNDSAVKLVGFSKEEMRNMIPDNFEVDFSKEKVQKRVEEILTNGFTNFETIIRHKDGHEINVEIKVIAINYKNQPALMNILRDITDRKLAEKSLQESEDRFKKLSTFTFEGIIIHTNAIAVDVNQSTVRMIGYQRDELIGMNLFNVIHPDYHAIVKENMAKNLAKPYQIVAIRKDGSTFDAEIEAENIWYNGEYFRVACIRDITERKKTERIIEKQNIQLMEAIATKDKFFNIIAHDLKSPFNAILGFSDMLIKNLERYDKERIRRYVTTINESGKNTFKLLENLLQWARSQQDKIPFKPETNNLFFLAYETYMLVNQNTKDKLITIDLNVPEDINIEADSEMLKTIIRNLVSNAIKYTTENGKITITGKQTHNEAIIEITDTGIGMNEETKNSLFKIGGSHSKVGTKGESGTGFGLLLCKEFVEKHNGTISVESELGKGSSFTVRLPIQLH